GFVVLTVLLVTCGLIARGISLRSRSPDANGDEGTEAAPPARPGPRTLMKWILLVFIPSSWLMGVTSYLTTDLAPMPMLWVIPLALYLLSFIVAFAGPDATAVRRAGMVLPILVLPLALVLSAGFVHAVWIPLHLLAFFAGAVACHGALARLRPPARRLSVFYVAIAVGGLMGG